MSNEIKFKKRRILLGVLFFVLLLVISISFLLTPEYFLRNIFSTTERIQVKGIILFIYSSTVLYSLANISTKKYTIRITDDFLIDNSKYESLGIIKWRDISKIQKLKKNNTEVLLNISDFKTEKSNLVKRYLMFMNNWNYKNSVLISSALLDCSLEELFDTISTAHKNNKLK